MKRYKDILAAKGSALRSAMDNNDKKLAEKIYKETSDNYKSRYSQEDRDWFAEISKFN